MSATVPTHAIQAQPITPPNDWRIGLFDDEHIASPATALVDHALALAEAGYHVFPCKAGEKIPHVKDWETVATLDPEVIRDWWKQWPDANIGSPPNRSGHFVVDLDHKNGKNGSTSLGNLEFQHDNLPETLTVKTPSGGLHKWFKGAAKNSAGGLGDGIDIRGAGGFVVMPGSVIGGKPYAFEGSAPIADAPEWLCSLVNAPKHVAPMEVPDGLEIDLPSNIERARRRLVDLVDQGCIATAFSGGDDATFKVACGILELGLSEDTALALLADVFNPACDPPWEDADLARITANAFTYMQNAKGAYGQPSPSETYRDNPAVKEALASQADAIATAQKATASGFVSWSDVLARDVPPVQELIPGLIERGTVTFLSAPGGSHKSRMAVQWGLCLDTGTPIFGRPVERSTFVYVSYEDHADEVARRGQQIARRLKLGNASGKYCDLAGKDSPLALVNENGTYELMPFWGQLVGYLQSIPGHKFVVLDGTYNALRFGGQAKINETSVMLGISLLQRICDECDATVMPLWHPSQSGQERGDASGWSVAWHNAPRARLSLSPVKGTEDAFELKVEKRNHGAKGKPLTLYWSDGVLLPRTQIDAAGQESRFMDACVSVALTAAAHDTPIQCRKKLHVWMLDEIENMSGRRPTQPEVKEELAKAVRLGKLRYQTPHGKNQAGYFPLKSDADHG